MPLIKNEDGRLKEATYEDLISWADSQGIDVNNFSIKGYEIDAIQEVLIDEFNAVSLENETRASEQKITESNRKFAEEYGIDTTKYTVDEVNEEIEALRGELKEQPLNPEEIKELGIISSSLFIESGVDSAKWQSEEGLSQREVYDRAKRYQAVTPHVEYLGTTPVPPYYYPMAKSMVDELTAKGVVVEGDNMKQKYFMAAQWYLQNDPKRFEEIQVAELGDMAIAQGTQEMMAQQQRFQQLPQEVKPFVFSALLKAQQFKAIASQEERLRHDVIRPTTTWETIKATPGRMWDNMPNNIINTIEGITSLGGMILSGAYKVAGGAYESLVKGKEGAYTEAATDVTEPVLQLSGAVLDSVFYDYGAIWSGSPNKARTPIGRKVATGVRNFKAQPIKEIAEYASENPLDFLLLVGAAESAGAKLLNKTSDIVKHARQASALYNTYLSTKTGTLGRAGFNANRLAQAALHATDTMFDFTKAPRKPYSLTSMVARFDKSDDLIGVEEKIIAKLPAYTPNDPFMNLFLKGSVDGVARKVPWVDDLLARNKMRGWVDDLRSQWDDWAFSTRTALNNEFARLHSRVPVDERAMITDFIEGKYLVGEGRKLMQYADAVPDMSDEFYDLYGYYHNVLDMIEDKKLLYGHVSKEVMDDLIYEPLITMTGKTKQEIIDELGDLSKVGVSYFKHMDSTRNLSDDVAMQTAKTLYPEMVKGRRSARTSEMFSSLRRKTESYQKKRHGLTNEQILDGGTVSYNTNFNEVVPWMVADYTRVTASEEMIRNIAKQFGQSVNLKNVEVLDQVKGIYRIKEAGGASHIADNVALFYPNGFSRFYKEKLDLYKTVINGLDDTIPDEAVAKFMLDKVGKEMVIEKLGITKDIEAFLIPKTIEKRLSSVGLAIPDWVRLAYDTPQALLTNLMLATPRWVTNNVVGDYFFALMSGTKMGSMTKAMTKYADVIPTELKKANTLYHLAKAENLGKAAETAIGGFITRLKQTGVYGAAKQVVDVPFKINSALEAPFSRGFYVQLAKKSARKLAGKVDLTDAEEYHWMYKIAHDTQYASTKADIFKKVAENYPIFNVTGKYERMVGRRLMPFYNWYKFMLTYGAKLPAKHPFKLVVADTLGDFSEEMREEAFIEYFPFMEHYISEHGIPNRYSGLWPTKRHEDGSVQMFNMGAKNPMTTIKEIAFGDPMSALSPLLRLPIEAARRESLSKSGKYHTEPTEPGQPEPRLPLNEMVLRTLPQYRLIYETVVPAKTYMPEGILTQPGIVDPQIIRDINTGEIRYPMHRLDALLGFVGLSVQNVRDDSMLTAIDEDIRYKMYKFKTDQWDKSTNLTLYEIDQVIRNVQEQLFYEHSEEADIMRRTRAALEQVRTDLKVNEYLRKGK